MIDITLPQRITVLSIDIYLYGIFLGLAIAIIYIKLEKSYPDDDLLIPFIIHGLASVVFGRLYYILVNPSYYISYPEQILRVDRGGISIIGVLIGIMLSSYILSRVRDHNYFKYLDRVAEITPIAQTVGRLGNFVNQELFGKPTSLPWGILIEKKNRPAEYIENQYFHPLFIYEGILNIISFYLIKHFSDKNKPYDSTSLFLINFGIIRLIMNRFRIDNDLFIGMIHVSDIFAILFILTGLMLRNRVRIHELLKTIYKRS